jgi:hypothetical protein
MRSILIALKDKGGMATKKNQHELERASGLPCIPWRYTPVYILRMLFDDAVTTARIISLFLITQINKMCLYNIFIFLVHL